MSQILYETTVAQNLSIPRTNRLLDWAVHLATKLQARLELEHARKVVRTLDARQLADAGIDASAVLPPSPTLVVERGLMTRLMSMR